MKNIVYTFLNLSERGGKIADDSKRREDPW
jgi:hypothetical protein